jgi:type IV pilus assembly protein PilA
MPPAYGYAPQPSKGGSGLVIGIAVAVAVILVIGILVAIALPTFLGARDRAQDKEAESNIRNAVAAAKTYYTDSNSYAGFTWIQAEQIEPALTWNNSPVALTDQVSVRGVSKQSVVLVTKSTSGHVFCFATGTLGDAEGTTDASAAGECAGGWPV